MRGSITNQRLLLRQVVKNHPEFEGMTVVEYADDGFSGMNFGRPQFNKMMNDLVRGNICCVIVKDLSRFARNYIEAGNYLERVFPMYHIRFIAVNDHYDSNDYIGMTGGMEMAFKNYMNTMYARDLSIKVTAGRNIMAREGLFVGPHAPYGYKKDRLVLETILCQNPSIWISKNEYPTNLVKSKFLKLNHVHLEYVMGCMKDNTTKVRNIKNYLLSALFNAPTTMGSYYQSEVSHDQACRAM